MATANSGAHSSDEANADKPGARLAQPTTNGLARRSIEADGWCYAQTDECRCDRACDGSRCALPLASDQPRLGEEPQPMLPGLEEC